MRETYLYIFWFLVVLFWTMVVIKRVVDKKNKTIRVGAAEIEWLKLRIELLTAPDDFKKKTKLEMLNYCPHLKIIYSNYNEQEIIEDIGKEVFPHYEYGF